MTCHTLKLVILDQHYQPTSLKQLQARQLLNPAFYGLKQLDKGNLIAFVKAHPQYSVLVKSASTARIRAGDTSIEASLARTEYRYTNLA